MDGINWHHGHIDEDTLTAYVFRAFYYVPLAFQLFWKELISKNHHIELATDTSSLEIKEIVAWPSWQVALEYQVLLKKLQKIETDKHKLPDVSEKKLSVVPDIVIETNDCILIVEAELSKEFEASQLIEQFMISHNLSAQERKKIFHLLLNKTLCRPGALDNVIKELCRTDVFKKIGIKAPDPDVISSHLLWFNWQNIIAIFQKCLELELSSLEKKIIKDTILTMLKAKNGRIHPVASPTSAIKNLVNKKDELISSIKYLQNFLRLNTEFIAAHAVDYKILVD